MLRAVEIGFPQREIAESAYQFQLRFDSKEYVMVGVNEYTDEVETEIPTLKIDFEAEQNQISRTKAFKASRDQKKWKASIDAIRAACVENKNVMPSLIDGVDAGVTLGEVSDIYREIFGTYSDPGLI